MTVAPRVSIGMPLYNGAKYVALTIESVLAQNYANLELVISDNASTDATEHICREFAARDPRVRYSRNAENVGLPNNFNKAFRLARGTYFKWMCCGDKLDPRFVERCIAVLDARPEVVLAYPVTRLFVDDPAHGEDVRDDFDLDIEDAAGRFMRYTTEVRLNNIMHGLYRSAVLQRTKLYSTFLGADYNMIAELVLHGRAVRLNEVLNFRRMQPETATKFLSEAALRAVYAPARPSGLTYQGWYRVFDYWKMVLKSRLALSHRLALLLYLSKCAYWQRSELLKELLRGRHST